MNGMLRSRTEIEAALKSAEEAFNGFGMIAEAMSNCQDCDSAHLRVIEDRAVGHGAIVHVLQWILGQHDDQGIDKLIISEIRPGVHQVSVHGSAREELQ